MHGRRRADIPTLPAEKLESQRQKVRLGFELIQQLLRRRASAIHTVDILRSTRKLIEFNPELATIWNYRREVLTKLLDQQRVITEGPQSLSCHGDAGNPKGIKVGSSEADSCAGSPGTEDDGGAGADCSNSSDSTCTFCQRDKELTQLLREELKLTASGFTKGASKAYCLWLHRSWTLARLVAREYERHTFHLSVPLPHECQGASSSPEAHKERQRQNQEQRKEQPNSEQHADCKCSRAPCLVVTSHDAGPGSVICGLDGALKVLQEELDACESLIKDVDGRNFHCWQHRSMVLVWKSAVIQYKQKQCDNGSSSRPSNTNFDFSNYSAWHLRSLLPSVQQQATQEFAWLWQGLYTEPTDQSLWQYYTWLLTGSRGVRAGRLLTVRGTVAASGVPSLYFFFAEPCALDTSKCRVESCDEEGVMTEVPGKWELLSSLYTERVSGFTSTLLRRNLRQLSRVWVFVADEESSAGEFNEKLRVRLALTLYGGPMRDNGSGIDAFHLQRLACHAPNLAPLLSPAAHRCSSNGHEIETPSPTKAGDGASSSMQSDAPTDAPLWKCLTVIRPGATPEAQTAESAALRPWALSDCATCTARCSVCKAEAKDLAAAGVDAEAVSFAEAVSAAGGSLSVGLSRTVAQQELSNIDQLLQLEPDCKGALDAKLRLLRVLHPHGFADYATCCSALMAMDAAHEHVYRDEAVSATVRETIWKRKCQAGTSLVVSSALEELNIERLPYPILLEATDVQELSLRNNPLTNEAMLDWHVPYLACLRRLDIRGTNISRLSILLLSVSQLPHIERIDASFTQLSPMDGNCPLAEDEKLRAALHASTLMEIDVTETPLAAFLKDGSVIFNCFEFVRISDGSRAAAHSVLRRKTV